MSWIAGNTLLALSAAASWGGGDFSGGMGVKSAGGSTSAALRVVIAAHSVSLAVLLLLLHATGAAVPHGAPLLWGLSAGVAAGLALIAFYLALARGAMGVAAAVSGLLAAAIPAVISIMLEGAPGALRITGFVIALIAIWVIAAGDSPENADGQKGVLGLAILGGLGFGYYFAALKFDNSLGVMEPIALARTASLTTCLVLLLVLKLRKHRDPQTKGPWLTRQALGWAMGIALLDTGGNLFFVAATRAGRLDVAAVLASLYPAGTILLAAWRLHERPTRRQLWGMAAALLAVVMITV